MRSRLLVLTVVTCGLTACGPPQAASTPTAPGPTPSADDCAYRDPVSGECLAIPIDRYDPGYEDAYEGVPDPFASPGEPTPSAG